VFVLLDPLTVDFETQIEFRIVMTYLESLWTGMTHAKKFVDRQYTLL
jgi:hypothetical protein